MEKIKNYISNNPMLTLLGSLVIIFMLYRKSQGMKSTMTSMRRRMRQKSMNMITYGRSRMSKMRMRKRK